ncbi:hypothetical protein P3S67_027663 [Capsicum chacoense]
MFRWLAGKSNTKIKEADLFNPTDDVVVHPWIVPIEQESVMTYYITLGYIDTIADPTVELINKKSDGATTIIRAVRQGQPNVEALHNQPTKADPGASSSGVVGVGGRHADTATTCDDEHCKDNQDKLFEKVEPIFKAVKEFKSKRGFIPSKKRREPYTPTMLIRGICDRTRMPSQPHQITPGLSFPPRLPDYDRYVYAMIVDLDFFKKIKDKYNKLNTEASNYGVGLDFYVSTLDLDEKKMIKYVRGERPNPHGNSWIEAKRILVVISVNDIHYWAVEILLVEKKIKVYDCNELAIDEVDLFLLVQRLMELLPILFEGE